VVPELASRLHEEKIIDLLEEVGLEQIKDVDFISYTCCPGLPGSFLVGITLANTLSSFLKKEKVPVHHIFGHIFSIFVERSLSDFNFPMLVLTVSGGHNELYLVTNKEKPDNLEDYLDKFAKNYSFKRDNLVFKVGPFSLFRLGFTLDDAA